jgi:uncharacterized protein YicC (UPF0701 family)
MSAAHKKALAQGRREGATVRRYLEAIECSRPRRGRPRTAASIKKQLTAVEKKLTEAESLARLQLLQQQEDLESALSEITGVSEIASLEKEFVKIARAYGERKGISYQTWRRFGVSSSVLNAAGVR